LNSSVYYCFYCKWYSTSSQDFDEATKHAKRHTVCNESAKG